jgi:hypothetical protein
MDDTVLCKYQQKPRCPTRIVITLSSRAGVWNEMSQGKGYLPDLMSGRRRGKKARCVCKLKGVYKKI